MTASVHTLNPRRNRDMERGRRAAAAVRASGGSAMDAALAQIGATFDEAAVINSFKMQVEQFIKLGTGHPRVRARYGARAEMLRNLPLDVAILKVEQWYKTERNAFNIASAIGRGSRLPVEVLRELRLILRIIRRSEVRDHFPAIVGFVIGERNTHVAEPLRSIVNAFSPAVAS